MLLPVLIALSALFALIFVMRVSAARRRELIARWPAILLALAALFALLRGALWPSLALGSLAALAWTWWPRLAARPASAPGRGDDPADAAARVLLGVSPNATESDIRAAYRAKMRRAHPDRGGSNAEAARLTAARDRLLAKARG